MTVADIKNIVQLIIFIITNGKEVVESMGEIVDEIKSWFHKEKTVTESEALKRVEEDIEPLVTAAKGRRATESEVKSAAKLMWTTPTKTRQKYTRRRVGKTAGRR